MAITKKQKFSIGMVLTPVILFALVGVMMGVDMGMGTTCMQEATSLYCKIYSGTAMVFMVLFILTAILVPLGLLRIKNEFNRLNKENKKVKK